jgi:hypothetical protein
MARAALSIVLALATLAFPAVALGLPTVTVRGRAVPIPGFPHTGNFFGAAMPKSRSPAPNTAAFRLR